ncbi:MAG: SUMF1/EgtB/PvdO family nonheme iron enzyme [Bacteroidota bacterium]
MKTLTKISLLAALFVFTNAKKSEPDVLQRKTIEQSVSKISEKLYAGKYEVSNLLYRIFLNDLKQTKQFEKLAKAQIDTLNWRDTLAFNEPYVEYYHKHPAYNNYPVVNVSYEGAELFCSWLTDKYNSFSKRKFKKVKFRLPTLKEWESAAHAGDELSVYPWGGSFLRNTKGQYLCNFSSINNELVTTDSIKKTGVCPHYLNFDDAADITAPVSSYYPNNFGIYNISGNVAEMVIEKGLAKGGSWKSFGYDVRIQSAKNYSKSASDIGFRYFMDDLE